MNLGTLSTAGSLASSALRRAKDYRETKAREAYSALETAANNVDAGEWLDEARQSAGSVTKAAHKRLDNAIAELADRGEDLYDTVTKQSKKAKRKADKKAKALQKKAKKKTAKKSKKKGKFWLTAAITALVVAAGAAVFSFFRRKEDPSDVPPRVEEFSGNEQTQGSKLVYTSQSESDLVEDGVTDNDRDEQLLDSIDEQLQKHQESQKPEETD